MRGKDRTQVAGIFSFRITPAYAGKSQRRLVVVCFGQDHPRLCGEKSRTVFPRRNPAGSPPPMRGKVPFVIKNVVFIGITPAYAGKSCNPCQVYGRRRDHPRLCGEKPANPRLTSLMLGSPPPMRGKGTVEKDGEPWFGITPAYAGKRSTPPLAHRAKQDHPRLCGEKWYRCFFCWFIWGSPPPMRGKETNPTGA